MIDGAKRCALRDLAHFRCRTVLPFRQAVNLIIEQKDLKVYVAAHQVNQMIPTDGQCIAISGHDPDIQFRPTRLQSRGNGRRPAVNRVHSVGIHIIWEPA